MDRMRRFYIKGMEGVSMDVDLRFNEREPSTFQVYGSDTYFARTFIRTTSFNHVVHKDFDKQKKSWVFTFDENTPNESRLGVAELVRDLVYVEALNEKLRDEENTYRELVVADCKARLENEREARASALQSNIAHAEVCTSRLVQLQTWFATQKTTKPNLYPAGFFGDSFWITSGHPVCPQCKHNMMKRIGSERMPIETLTQREIEQCPFCEYHFFGHWE